MGSEVAETDEMQQYQERWRLEQDTLKQQLIEDDVHGWDLSKNQESQLKVLCGVDISFVKDTDEACACVVFMSFPELEVIHTEMQLVTMQLPYIAGFLAFREVNFLVELYQKAVAATGIEADVILADGNGILHHRGFGIASHLGVLLGVPTIGVAKKLLAVDGLDSDTVKALTQTPEADELISHNSFVAKDIVGESGRVWGSVVRPTAGTKNPVYVSVGHRVSLETAVEVVRCTSKFRVPEPVRQADLLSRQFLRDLDAAS